MQFVDLRVWSFAVAIGLGARGGQINEIRRKAEIGGVTVRVLVFAEAPLTLVSDQAFP
jgi:hypothetical protein